MFSFADVFHFFADKFARLGGRRFPFARVFFCSFDRFFFWHNESLSLLRCGLDVAVSLWGFRRADSVEAAAVVAAAVTAAECEWQV